jgi:hypothetical protein
LDGRQIIDNCYNGRVIGKLAAVTFDYAITLVPIYPGYRYTRGEIPMSGANEREPGISYLRPAERDGIWLLEGVKTMNLLAVGAVYALGNLDARTGAVFAAAYLLATLVETYVRREAYFRTKKMLEEQEK